MLPRPPVVAEVSNPVSSWALIAAVSVALLAVFATMVWASRGWWLNECETKSPRWARLTGGFVALIATLFILPLPVAAARNGHVFGLAVSVYGLGVIVFGHLGIMLRIVLGLDRRNRDDGDGGRAP